MASKNAQKSAPQTARAPHARQAITLELAARLAPNATHAEKISATFGLDPVDFDGIREATEEQIGLTAYALFAAATGAVHAYAELTGEDWKPYEAPADRSRGVNRQAASTELDALG